MSKITIPATGSGDATPEVATDQIGSEHYQYVKIADGTVGGSQPATVDTLGNLRVALAAATALVGASISNFPATQPVSVASVAAGLGPLGASVANFPAVQPVSGSVAITNQPANQSVTIASTAVTQPVTGYLGASITNAGALSAASQVLVGGSATVYVASQPAQMLTGLVGASLSGGLAGASVSNFPAEQQVVIASSAITVPISGGGGSMTVYVASQPAGVLVGYVGASIANQPTNQQVTIASSTITQPVSGNVVASVIGYVGASLAGTPTVSAQNVGGSTIAFPAAAPVAGLGASPYHYVAGASVNQVNVKNAAGTLYTLAAMNQNINQRYLKLFDKASTPSPGTDIPVQTYMLPGASAGAGAVIPLPVGLLFANGIGFAITANITDLDATNVSASDVVVNLAFK